MATAKIGQVIKFKNLDGTLNGGTLVDIVEKQSNNPKALVNTFDEKRITMPLNNIIIIKHQREGKASNAIIKRTINECKAHNKQLQEYGKNEKQEKTLEQKYEELLQERNTLLCKVNNIPELEKKLVDMNDAYMAVCEKLEKCQCNQSDELVSLRETVESLSNCILMLNANQEKDAFEYLLTRIKKFHSIV